jgi:hypothetical protein
MGLLDDTATYTGYGLILTLIVDVIFQLLAWGVSAPLKTERFYDCTYFNIPQRKSFLGTSPRRLQNETRVTDH